MVVMPPYFESSSVVLPQSLADIQPSGWPALFGVEMTVFTPLIRATYCFGSMFWKYFCRVPTDSLGLESMYLQPRSDASTNALTIWGSDWIVEALVTIPWEMVSSPLSSNGKTRVGVCAS